MDAGTYPRVGVLGVGISAITMADAVAAFAGSIERGERRYVCVVPAHSVMDCVDDPAVREIVNAAGLVTPDGMPLVWLLRLRGHRQVERVYGPDLMLEVCRESVSRGWRHALVGGEEGVAAELGRRLVARFPGLQVAGAFSPPFHAASGEDEVELAQAVNRSRPDIVWVGLGSPKQERWMARNRRQLDAAILVGVGAAFDFLSGRRKQAPRWIQRSGLEWLYRLASEPRRLWRRYARYPRFVGLVALEAAGLWRPGAGPRR